MLLCDCTANCFYGTSLWQRAGFVACDSIKCFLFVFFLAFCVVVFIFKSPLDLAYIEDAHKK